MIHTVATIRANTRRAYGGVLPPSTVLFSLAMKYEASYRRWRRAKRVPAREHLFGAVQTARAFYSLAREAGKPRLSWYQSEIKRIVAELGQPDVNTEWVEEWMRVTHSTLDGLSRDEFFDEVALALECIRVAGDPWGPRH